MRSPESKRTKRETKLKEILEGENPFEHKLDFDIKVEKRKVHPNEEATCTVKQVCSNKVDPNEEAVCTVNQVDSNEVDANEEATCAVKHEDSNNNSDLSLLLKCELKMLKIT